MGSEMNPFGGQGLSTEKLELVSVAVQAMKKLGLGKGYKKDASLSSVKSLEEKRIISKQVDEIMYMIDGGGYSILALLEVAKRLKREYERYSRDIVPSALNEAGMRTLELMTGEKLIVSDKIEASVADKNYMFARLNMIQAEKEDRIADGETAEDALKHATENIDSMFKKFITVDNPTDELKELLLENDVEYDNKATIHWQTLRKYCAGRREGGKNIPEGITAFEYVEAELK